MIEAKSSIVPRWFTAIFMFFFSLVLLLGSIIFPIVGSLYYFLTILICLLLWLFVDGQEPGDLGIRLGSQWFVSLILGVGLGSITMAAIIGLSVLSGWIVLNPVFGPTEGGIVGMYLVVYAMWQSTVAGAEELVGRGYIQQNLASKIPSSMAIFSAGVMFGILHLPGIMARSTPLVPSIIMLVNLCLGGIMLGLAFERSHMLWLPIGIHFGWNFIQYHVFGFGGNGLYSVQSVVFELITGGVIGPEAGLIGTLALLILIGVIWRLPSTWIQPYKTD
jgi:membrane protease YdiL (CAAX protease family)